MYVCVCMFVVEVLSAAADTVDAGVTLDAVTAVSTGSDITDNTTTGSTVATSGNGTSTTDATGASGLSVSALIDTDIVRRADTVSLSAAVSETSLATSMTTSLITDTSPVSALVSASDQLAMADDRLTALPHTVTTTLTAFPQIVTTTAAASPHTVATTLTALPHSVSAVLTSSPQAVPATSSASPHTGTTPHTVSAMSPCAVTAMLTASPPTVTAESSISSPSELSADVSYDVTADLTDITATTIPLVRTGDKALHIRPQTLVDAAAAASDMLTPVQHADTVSEVSAVTGDTGSENGPAAGDVKQSLTGNTETGEAAGIGTTAATTTTTTETTTETLSDNVCITTAEIFVLNVIFTPSKLQNYQFRLVFTLWELFLSGITFIP